MHITETFLQTFSVNISYIYTDIFYFLLTLYNFILYIVACQLLLVCTLDKQKIKAEKLFVIYLSYRTYNANVQLFQNITHETV